MSNWDKNPILEESVDSSNELKSFLVNYVGNKINPDNNDVTVENIVEVMSKDFPEFLMAVAEENFIRGYHQALHDTEVGEKLYNEQLEKNKKQSAKDNS